jgi:hypothetical protein
MIAKQDNKKLIVALQINQDKKIYYRLRWKKKI